jgi:hypothetical protein
VTLEGQVLRLTTDGADGDSVEGAQAMAGHEPTVNVMSAPVIMQLRHPVRPNPWSDLVAIDRSAAPFRDQADARNYSCYRPLAFTRLVDHDGAVIAVVNTFARTWTAVDPTLAAWLSVEQPSVWRRIVEGATRHGGVLAVPYSSADLSTCSDIDLAVQIQWGWECARERFGTEPSAMFIGGGGVDDRVAAALAAAGIRLAVIGPRVVVSSSVASGMLESNDGRLLVRRATSSVGVDLEDVNDSVGAKRFGAALATADAHHPLVIEAEAAFTSQRDRRRAVAEALSVGAAEHQLTAPSIEAWTRALGAPIPLGDSDPDPVEVPVWVDESATLVADAARRIDVTLTAMADRDLRDGWTSLLRGGSVIAGSMDADDWARAEARGPSHEAGARLALEALRYRAVLGSGLRTAASISSAAAVDVISRTARCGELLADEGLDLSDLADRLPAIVDAEGTTADTVWNDIIQHRRIDTARVVAHFALVEALRAGSVTTDVAGYDIAVDRHATSATLDGSVRTGVIRLRHRRLGTSGRYAYAIAVSNDSSVVGALRQSMSVPDDDRAALELHRAASTGATTQYLQDLLVERFGPNMFGLDALIGDAAPRVLADVAQDSMTTLARRAVSTDNPVDVNAVDRFWSTIVDAGLDVDPAPAQEALCAGLVGRSPSPELARLARRLGVNPAAVRELPAD